MFSAEHSPRLQLMSASDCFSRRTPNTHKGSKTCRSASFTPQSKNKQGIGYRVYVFGLTFGVRCSSSNAIVSFVRWVNSCPFCCVRCVRTRVLLDGSSCIDSSLGFVLSPPETLCPKRNPGHQLRSIWSRSVVLQYQRTPGVEKSSS